MENSSSAENGGAGGGGGVGLANGITDEQTPQLFCLRWNNYQSNLTNVFDQLLQNESFVDVTLACADGHSVKAHKMVLSACSPYFQSLFFENPCKHPIVILKDIKWTELKAAIEFMYKGEINVCQEQIGPLLKVAESLKIRGLADVSNEQEFTSERRSPTSVATAAAAQVTASAEIRRSPSRANSSNAPIPSKKRRRTSADRGCGSGANAEETISVINSPSRALELITSPSSCVGSAGTPLSACGMAGLSAAAQSGGNRPSQSSTPQSPSNMTSLPLPPPSATLPSTSSVTDDMEIKPGIAEMIREEERAKMLESSQAWLNASTSSLAYYQPPSSMALASHGQPLNSTGSVSLKLKAPTWTQLQLKEAIQAVVTQRMRFTQASVHFGIPKGTLYDNILGKTKRMQALEEAALTPEEETAVLEFCCQVSASPYNRRTRKSLAEVLAFVQTLRQSRDPSFEFNELSGFRWWWAFCKKHSIVSLHFSGSASRGKSSAADQGAGGASMGWTVDNEVAHDYSTRDCANHHAIESGHQGSLAAGFGSLQEYLKLSVESSLTTLGNAASEANKFLTIQEIHTKTPICH